MYVMGMYFVVVTNHLALKGTRTKAELASQIQLFSNKLLLYNYNIGYCRGKKKNSHNLLS